MIAVKKIFLRLVVFIASAILLLFIFYIYSDKELNTKEKQINRTPSAGEIAGKWSALAGKRRGKVVFARPPRMMVLDLTTGIEKEIPNVITAGAAGRYQRGKSPRPSWSPKGDRFVYRYNHQIYICDETGHQQIIANPQMDCADETRWSWLCRQGNDWLVGPSREANVILILVSNPDIVLTAYSGGDVEKHCEITATGRYVVYDDGSDIFVTPFGGSGKKIKISEGQSCRPCASPDDRVAWLMAPHTKYRIYDAANGMHMGDLDAPPGEEIYRLNWSNDPDFAVHMLGSGGNTKMNVRKISSGDFLFIGYGWDPDLWME